jgi:Ca2+:H+ antiporter
MKESKPTIIEAYVDPFEPPMPPKVEMSFVNNLAESFARGQPYASRIGLTLFKNQVQILVGSVESAPEEFGFGQLFVGAIIAGLVGNAAEHSSAIILVTRNKLDPSIGIAAGSGTQVALFVAPVLVIVGIFIGKPYTLVFTLFELAALILDAIMLNWISRDGKSYWFEGVMLTAVFIVIAISFFLIG